MKPTTTLFLPIAIGLVSSSYANTNTRIFLHPSPLHTINNDLSLTSREASRAVAKFIGLDLYELSGEDAQREMDMYADYEAGEVKLGNTGDRLGFLLDDEDTSPFVGKGMGRSLVIGVDVETELEAIIPHTLPLTFSATSDFLSIPFSSSSPTLSLATLVERASDFYDYVWTSPVLSSASSEPRPFRHLDIFDLPRTQVSSSFLRDLGSLVEFVEWNEASAWASDIDGFAAIDLTSLRNLTEQYGRDSAQCRAATSAVRAAINTAMTHANLKIVVIAAPVQANFNVYAKRQQQPSQSPLPVPSPPPHHPISAVSTCYPSLDACTNSTNSCSSHGQCLSASKAGKTCFVCACTATKSINGNGMTQTTLWAGEQCERIDISQEFVLLTGSVVGLIVLVVGAILLLSGVGSEKLPQVLAEGNVPTKRE